MNRDEYAAQLRERLGESSDTSSPAGVTNALTDVAARLLDELAGVYKDEDLGQLAGDVSKLLDGERHND